MIEPSRVIPSHQSCRSIRKNEPYNCKTVNNKMICEMRGIVERDCRFVPTQFLEPVYQTRDINERERESDLKLCIQSKGYRWEKID